MRFLLEKLSKAPTAETYRAIYELSNRLHNLSYWKLLQSVTTRIPPNQQTKITYSQLHYATTPEIELLGLNSRRANSRSFRNKSVRYCEVSCKTTSIDFSWEQSVRCWEQPEWVSNGVLRLR